MILIKKGTNDNNDKERAPPLESAAEADGSAPGEKLSPASLGPFPFQLLIPFSFSLLWLRGEGEAEGGGIRGEVVRGYGREGTEGEGDGGGMVEEEIGERERDGEGGGEMVGKEGEGKGGRRGDRKRGGERTKGR